MRLPVTPFRYSGSVFFDFFFLVFSLTDFTFVANLRFSSDLPDSPDVVTSPDFPEFSDFPVPDAILITVSIHGRKANTSVKKLQYFYRTFKLQKASSFSFQKKIIFTQLF